MGPLLYPYAYDPGLNTYFAPNDSRVMPGKDYKVGYRTVRLRIISGKRPHFWDPSGLDGVSGGRGGGGGPETAAHIFAKKFYQERMCFSAIINKQRILIRFETCVLEQRLDERTPDLLATISECWPPFFAIGSQFILEIHATNAIDDNVGRHAALEAIGVPCIEVHLGKNASEWIFDSRNDPDREWRKFERYMAKVLTTPYNVQWIVPTPAPVFAEPANSLRLVH